LISFVNLQVSRFKSYVDSNAVFENLNYERAGRGVLSSNAIFLFGRPPRPPKITARELAEPEDPQRVIHLPDPVVVADLAVALKLKPFKVVADLLLLRQFKGPEDAIDFRTAAMIASWHDYIAIESLQ